jgi:anti-sigma factor ChrR (cupin superfamily)
MTKNRSGRRIINIHRTEFQPYSQEGPVQPDIGWMPLSVDEDRNGCYVMRMEPGAETIAHTHAGMEDFLILEGELIDDDGVLFKAGDFVSYQPGTRHNSRTKTGCLLIGVDWGKPKAK